MRPSKTIPPAPPLDWLLVANASRARCFARDPDNGAMRELLSVVHPSSRLPAQQLAHDRGGKAMKSQASTQYQPHTDPHQKEHQVFARELAAHLEQAALAHTYPGVALIASLPFLGVLNGELGPATQARLQASIALDLTSFEGAELEHRVSAALKNAIA
jgi:protein required for attachment to host cells